MHLLANLIDQYLYFLVHLKGMLTHRFVRKHYGQWAEDVIIDSLTAGKRAGVYVDVGAYHPFHYSNTYLLYHRGWHGINIDPNPSAIMLFNWHRKRDINLNLGVSDIPGEKKEESLDEFGHMILKDRGVAERLTKIIEAETEIETRSAVIGHMQRGGAPTLFDRILGTRVGVLAADLVHAGKFGHMAALKGDSVVAVSLEAATAKLKTVPPEWLKFSDDLL